MFGFGDVDFGIDGEGRGGRRGEGEIGGDVAPEGRGSFFFSCFDLFTHFVDKFIHF